MLLLTSTSDLIQVTTSAAVATHVQASFVDNASGTITPGRTNTIISTATTTTVVASPAASTQRNVKELTVMAVGGAQTVTVIHTDGTTAVNLVQATLAQNEALVFTDGQGFQILDVNGAVKSVFSAALPGTPTAPTAPQNTNTTQVATTAFVLGQAATALPLIDGTAAAGVSTRWSAGDHVHPTDTTRAPLASPTFTGAPAIPGAVSALAGSPLPSVYASYFVTNGSTQSLTSGANPVVNFTTKDIDTDNAVTTGAAWHFTVPTGKGGLYRVEAAVTILVTGSNGGGFELDLFNNGSIIKVLSRLESFSTAAVQLTVSGAITVKLAAADAIDIRVFQNTGNTGNLSNTTQANWVTITRVPGS